MEQPKKLAPVVDLMAALKESLENAKKPAASEKRIQRANESQVVARATGERPKPRRKRA